jgi:hypothetical protein
LELLVDFVTDVPIIRMEFLQFALKSINIGGREDVGRDIALRCPDAAARRPYLGTVPIA